MKKFKFRLEKVLQYREIIKSERLKELTEKRTELRQAEEQLEFLLQEQLRNGVLEGQFLSQDLILYGAYGARLKGAIQEQRGAIAVLQEEVEKSLLAYQEAAQDAEALVTLKEKKKEEYDKLLDHWESKFLDELATMRSKPTTDEVIEDDAEEETNHDP